MDDDCLVECRVCGQHWRSLGHHLRWGHDMSPDEYRDCFGIRRGVSLTSPAMRERWSASMKATIAAGKLDAHYAGNAERAVAAGKSGIVAKRAIGRAAFPGHSHLTRESIAAVVTLVEAGMNVATAVKRAGISYSAYHAGLGRHPDLKLRHIGRGHRRNDA